MKTLSLPQPSFNSLFKRNTSRTATPAKSKPSTSQTDQKHHFTAGEYIVSALEEGFKQNFLGSDINMEFLTLTVRSYADSTVKAIRKIVNKSAA